VPILIIYFPESVQSEERSDALKIMASPSEQTQPGAQPIIATPEPEPPSAPSLSQSTRRRQPTAATTPVTSSDDPAVPASHPRTLRGRARARGRSRGSGRSGVARGGNSASSSNGGSVFNRLHGTPTGRSRSRDPTPGPSSRTPTPATPATPHRNRTNTANGGPGSARRPVKTPPSGGEDSAHERLYAKSTGHIRSRSLSVGVGASNGDLDCTFRPNISSSQTKVKPERQADGAEVHERLYLGRKQHLSTPEQNRRDRSHSLDPNECTFKPDIGASQRTVTPGKDRLSVEKRLHASAAAASASEANKKVRSRSKDTRPAFVVRQIYDPIQYPYCKPDFTAMDWGDVEVDGAAGGWMPTGGHYSNNRLPDDLEGMVVAFDGIANGTEDDGRGALDSHLAAEGDTEGDAAFRSSPPHDMSAFPVVNQLLVPAHNGEHTVESLLAENSLLRANLDSIQRSFHGQTDATTTILHMQLRIDDLEKEWIEAKTEAKDWEVKAKSNREQWEEERQRVVEEARRKIMEDKERIEALESQVGVFEAQAENERAEWKSQIRKEREKYGKEKRQQEVKFEALSNSRTEAEDQLKARNDTNLNKMKERSRSLYASLSSLRTEHSLSSEKIKDQEETLLSLTAERGELEKKCKSLTLAQKKGGVESARLTKAEGEARHLRAECEKLTAQLLSSETAQNERAMQQQQLIVKSNEAGEEDRLKLTDALRIVQSLSTERNALKEDVRTLWEQLAESAQNSDGAGEEMQVLQSAVVEAEERASRLEGVEETLSESQSELVSVRAEAEKLRKNAEGSSLKCKELSEELERVRGEFTAVDRLAAEMRQSAQSAGDRSAAFCDEISALRDDRDKLAADLEATTADTEEIRAKHNEMKAAVKHLQSQLDETEGRNIMMENEQKKSLEELTALKKRIEWLSEEIARRDFFIIEARQCCEEMEKAKDDMEMMWKMKVDELEKRNQEMDSLSVTISKETMTVSNERNDTTPRSVYTKETISPALSQYFSPNTDEMLATNPGRDPTKPIQAEGSPSCLSCDSSRDETLNTTVSVAAEEAADLLKQIQMEEKRIRSLGVSPPKELREERVKRTSPWAGSLAKRIEKATKNKLKGSTPPAKSADMGLQEHFRAADGDIHLEGKHIGDQARDLYQHARQFQAKHRAPPQSLAAVVKTTPKAGGVRWSDSRNGGANDKDGASKLGKNDKSWAESW